MPEQQHFSIVLPVTLHSNLPSFCFSQQQVFTSLPVRLQTSLGEAAIAAAETNIAAVMTAMRLVICFIISHLIYVWLIRRYTLESNPRSMLNFVIFSAASTCAILVLS